MSNNLKRKLKRKNFLKNKKNAEKDLEKRVKSIFLPDFCKNCDVPFDKKSKTHAKTWRVVSKNEGEDKYLLCPVCWDKIEELISPE